MSSKTPANLMDVLRETLAIIRETHELPQDSPASEELRRSIVRAIGALSILKTAEAGRERKQPPALSNRPKIRVERVKTPFRAPLGTSVHGAAKSGLRLQVVWSAGDLRGSIGEPFDLPPALRPDVEG
ncbi:MAG TPA: hypothetical protein VL991_03605 [Terracidiphilus sp.]|jgi:hypothetical protein|nr:hypothetical protein [Terracidiphilus sp.]